MSEALFLLQGKTPTAMASPSGSSAPPTTAGSKAKAATGLMLSVKLMPGLGEAVLSLWSRWDLCNRMTRAEGCPALRFGVTEALSRSSVPYNGRCRQSYQGSDNGLSNLTQHELALACLRLGSYSLEAASLQETATAARKQVESWKDAVFHLSAVSVMQHKENLVETKRDEEFTAAAAASAPIPGNLSKQRSHVAC